MKTLSRVVHSADPRGVLSLQDELLVKLNPALRKVILDGVLTERITLTDQWQNVSHGLGRTPMGWIAVEPQYAAPVWTDITSFSNNWASTAGPPTAGCTILPGGVIQLRGAVYRTAGVPAAGETIFTLPSAFGSWPYTHRWVQAGDNGGGMILSGSYAVGGTATFQWYMGGYSQYLELSSISVRSTLAQSPVEETETDNPDRSLFLRLRTCNSGSTTKLWVF